MDFRVYLDGVQRIVSGVTLETTCKDIVLCLAQATQQFGKFILVERWRNNERLLNPNDYPIKLLSQWGEYAPDVIFIMKRCDQPLTDPTSKLHTSTNHNLQLQNKLKQQQQQSRQYQSNDVNLVSSKANQSKLVESEQLESANLRVESHDLYGSCIPQKHVYNQEEKLINMPSKSSSQSIPPNQNSVTQEFPVDTESDYATNQALMKRPRHPPPYYEAITKSALLRSSPSDPVEASPETSGKHRLQEESGNLSKCSKEINRCSNCEDPDESQRTVRISRNLDEAKNKQIYRHDETRINDVKLSNIQKDTLNSTYRQVLEISSPVNYWDPNYRSSSAQQRQDILSDSRRFDRLSEIQQESILNLESDQLYNDDELTRLDTIEVDKNKLRIQLSEIENQIADCRHSIEQLMDQINQLNIQKEEEELLKRREETKEKAIEFELQSEQLRMVDEELKESDEMLKERIKKIEKILHDLKEANLQGLSLLPREELLVKNASQMKTSQSHVIINPESRNSFQFKQQRPGSTRKMFVPPRELKNAVATSKNPHGVWV